MAAVNTQAVVLRGRNVSEADRLLTFYTREFGKLRLRASGLRKPTARLASMLEPFSHVEISLTLRQGQAIGRLINARLLSSGVALAHPLERFSAACLISEIANRFTAEADKNQKKFDLIQRAFENLAVSGSPLEVACQFALQFVSVAGHGLHLSQTCHLCGTQDFLYLASGQGGIVCRGHRGELPAVAVAPNEIKLLRELLDAPEGSEPQMPKRLLRLILFYLQNILGEPLSSAAFVLGGKLT